MLTLFLLLSFPFLVFGFESRDVQLMKDHLHHQLVGMNIGLPLPDRPFDFRSLEKKAIEGKMLSRKTIRTEDSNTMMAFKVQKSTSCGANNPHVFTYGFSLASCFKASNAYFSNSFKYECAGSKIL